MSQSDPGKPFDCPSHRAIRLLQEKWVLNIVRALLDGPRGFNELGRDAGGCNPSTLTQRLSKLEQLGVVCKRCDPECGRGSYALTPAGEGLSDVLEAIESWASSHLAQGPGATASPFAAESALRGGDGHASASPAATARLAASPANGDGHAPVAPPRAHPRPVASPDGVGADPFRLDGARIDLDRAALRRPSAASTRARVARTLAGSNTNTDDGGEVPAGEGTSPSA